MFYIWHTLLITVFIVIAFSLGYKLGYYMTAQGSMLAFIILIFWSNNRQEKLDREFGFSDEDREED